MSARPADLRADHPERGPWQVPRDPMRGALDRGGHRLECLAVCHEALAARLLEARSVEDVDRALEKAITLGGRVLLAAQNQFWGDRTARVMDPSGHVWTLASRIEDTTEDQRRERWDDIRKNTARD